MRRTRYDPFQPFGSPRFTTRALLLFSSLPVLLFSLLFVLLFLPAVQASTQGSHLTLLTVGERPDGTRVGGTADLFLTIRPGSGQIFLDTQPLTRIDTQSSARYANRVACAYTQKACSRYDFFYTIRAGSSVVGGPSAGAAIAVLTAAMLEGKHLNESVAITGTINSGGIVGPVAGEQEKITAAKAAGITTVLLSAFSTPSRVNKSYLALLNKSKKSEKENQHGEENRSVNLSRLSTPLNLSSFGIRVVQVSTLDEAMAYFTGERHREATPQLTVPASYTVIMRRVAHTLCGRRDGLLQNATSILNTTLLNASRLNLSRAALHRQDWYSAASYCFGDLIRLRGALFGEETPEGRNRTAERVLAWISSYATKVDRHPLRTLGDLETKLIVTERLDEAQKALQETNITAGELGFAYERAYSAEAWSAFFAMKGPAIKLDGERSKEACEEKLAESRERASYIGLYLPASLLKGVNEGLNAAEQDARRGRYEECLFRAAKAAAETNLLAGSLAVPKQKIDRLVTKKLEAVAEVIGEESERGFFPILGYSYYRYATSLAASDPYSALTFAEQALELSDLDIYFPRRAPFRLPEEFYYGLLFLSGVVLGAAVTVLAMRRRPPRSKRGLKESTRRTTSRRNGDGMNRVRRSKR